jgi:hypothetical protein
MTLPAFLRSCFPYWVAGEARAMTDALVRLFNPRIDAWPDHFMWEGAVLMGLTPIGRATIEVLQINSVERVEHRRLLLVAGTSLPPTGG